MLNPRETRLMHDLVDIWRPARRQDSVGRPSDPSYTLLAAGVTCYFDTDTSLDQPRLFGRAEHDILFTLDQFIFAKGQDIQSEDILILKSIDADGTKAMNWGRPWAVRGFPERVTDQGSRRASMVGVFASQIDKLPPSVVVGT